MKNKYNYLTILVIFLLSACKKEEIIYSSPIPLKTVCKIISIVSTKNTNPSITTNYKYDSKDRLVKHSFGNTAISYVYNQNDFLTERTTKYSETYFITDKFSYTNEKLIAIDNTITIGPEITKSKTTYEYDTSGKLLKIIMTDAKNNQIISTYKDNILTAQTSNLNTYEVNELGLITKIITKVSDSFSSVGQFTRYTYDKNGQTINRENVNKDGKIVASFVNEYSEFKDLGIGFQDYMKGKGFPIIGPVLPKYHIKKETTFLLDNRTNKMYEHVSFSSENYKLDKEGKLLSLSVIYRTTNPNDDSTTNIIYNYEGCN
jgi:hypothetical protein